MLQRGGNHPLDGTDGVDEDREGVTVAQDRPAAGGLLERLEGDLAGELVAGPWRMVELVEFGEVVDDGGPGPTNDGDAAVAVGLWGNVKVELDPGAFDVVELRSRP
jgi:hypothetical protein